MMLTKIISPKFALKGLIIVIFALFMVILSFGIVGAAGSNEYEFTNKEGKDVNDIHIEFTQKVTWDVKDDEYRWQDPSETFRNNNGSGGKKVDLAAGITGKGVKKDGKVILTFTYPGSVTPQVKLWYWTLDGVKVGSDKKPKSRKFNFSFAMAIGDGGLWFGRNTQSLPFLTIAGETGEACAARFAAEANSFFPNAIIEVDPTDPRSVLFQSALYGIPDQEFWAEIEPCATDVITVEDIPINCEDTDGDGVIDEWDECEGTPAGSLVDSRGCPEYPRGDFDGDNQLDLGDVIGILRIICGLD